MFSVPRPIVYIHRFCVNHLVYPLVLSSLFACVMFLGRVYLTRSWGFRFLVWNLFLAWVPYIVSLFIVLLHRQYPRRWWLIAIPSLVWLIFLPNAPYIVTDLWHVQGGASTTIWYLIGMIAAFAWSGLFLAVASLYLMQNVVRDYVGGWASWLFALITMGLSGFGIYLGRFLNWNSWDFFLMPREFISDTAPRVFHLLRDSQSLGVTVVFAALFGVCYFTFVSMEHRQIVQIDNDTRSR